MNVIQAESTRKMREAIKAKFDDLCPACELEQTGGDLCKSCEFQVDNEMIDFERTKHD